ncbi:hypothetical protein CRYUN_Cryun09bG0219400 [Craigia yunnanensis]
MSLSTVDLLLGKIISILENEASLLSGVRDEINEINLELNSMRSFLEDSYRTAGQHSQAMNDWVANVRDIACEIEDVLHEFMYHMSKQQQWRGNKYTSFFLKGIHFPHNLFLRHKTADKLQKINKKLINMQNRNKRYGVNQLEGKDDEKMKGMPHNYDPNWLKTKSESSLFLKDDDLVGIETTQSKLLSWLADGELQRIVISVVGMGGSGKTTLVANTFNKEKINQHFECYAWITVSQQYAVEELLRSMIKEIVKETNEKNLVNMKSMSYRDLGEMLKNYLQTRRYLIVLDDVWSIELWKLISRVLPNGRNGSRLMITTRMRDVASFQFGTISHILELKPLRDDDAWTLFCMKAFPSNLGQCPPHLDSLARNLAEKCEGLPLAIVALGGLLSCKTSIDECRIVYDNLNWELSNNLELGAVKCILLLSYHQLPYRLKHCFLYCCIFPEDYSIKRKRLIRLWMAEGFVEPLKETTPEVVADRYLNELICRGLLQVVLRNESGRPKVCKMHDILRELALSIAKAEKFVAKSDGKEVEDHGIRRLSIEAKGKEMKAEGKSSLSQLHSLFVFAVDEISKSSFNRLPPGFKLLRVLDLEDTPINELPGELVNLFNLKYLNLTRTQVKELPKSIGKLNNLQSLLIRQTQIKELPPGIVKLKNLRHLIAYRYNVTGMEFDYTLGTGVPSNICLLKSLQVLSFVEARGNFIKQLRRMTQLRRLSVANVKEADEKDLCLSIGNLSLLRYLIVMSSNAEERLKMDALVSTPRQLEKLCLAGKLEKLPHWFNSLDNLTCLHLHWSRLRDDFLPHIQALPNLGAIALVNAYEGERLYFQEGFQKLKRLSIVKCPRLKEIAMNKGVMPGLEELSVINCQEFMRLPHGWESLPVLKEVYLKDVSGGNIEKIYGLEIMDQPPIKAIMLRRQEDGEAVFKCVYKIYY